MSLKSYDEQMNDPKGYKDDTRGKRRCRKYYKKCRKKLRRTRMKSGEVFIENKHFGGFEF